MGIDWEGPHVLDNDDVNLVQVPRISCPLSDEAYYLLLSLIIHLLSLRCMLRICMSEFYNLLQCTKLCSYRYYVYCMVVLKSLS